MTTELKNTLEFSLICAVVNNSYNSTWQLGMVIYVILWGKKCQDRVQQYNYWEDDTETSKKTIYIIWISSLEGVDCVYSHLSCSKITNQNMSIKNILRILYNTKAPDMVTGILWGILSKHIFHLEYISNLKYFTRNMCLSSVCPWKSLIQRGSWKGIMVQTNTEFCFLQDL